MEDSTWNDVAPELGNYGMETLDPDLLLLMGQSSIGSTDTDFNSSCDLEPPLSPEAMEDSTWNEQAPELGKHQSETLHSNLLPMGQPSIANTDWGTKGQGMELRTVELEPTGGHYIGPSKLEIWRFATILKDLQRLLEEHFDWAALPQELQQRVLKEVPFETIFVFQCVSKELRGLPQNENFQQARGTTHTNECSLSSMFFLIRDGTLHCLGFDPVSKKWRRLPPLKRLPPPDPELFKDYLIAGGGGLFCAEVSKDRNVEKLVVVNPLTQSFKELPPLNFRRHPVLMYVLAQSETKGYQIIVAGSSGMDSPELSRKTEVYDSLTEEWRVVGDIPGEEFSLNEYQTGAHSDGQLYCVAFVGDGTRKGVLAYDVHRGEWDEGLTILLPSRRELGNNVTDAPVVAEPLENYNYTIAQLVETSRGVYLFTEQEEGQVVTQFLHKLDGGRWIEVMSHQKRSGRGLLVYPEYTCVAHGDGRFCIFNTIEHTGVVYDIDSNTRKLLEPSPPLIPNAERFHSLNPLTYTFQPSFTTSI